MPPSTINDMAARFAAAYQALKDKKDTDRLLALIKPMILSAKADGISDKELIDLINCLGLREKFYPTKLKELRGRLAQAESGQPDSEKDAQPPRSEAASPAATKIATRLDVAAP